MVGLERQILRESSHRRKRKFSESREHYLIDRTAFHIWSFGRGGFLTAGKLSAASISGRRRVCHSVLPKHAYKIVVDGIENDAFHPKREDDWFLVHQATDPKRPSLTSCFPKKGTGKRFRTVYRVLTAANLLRVALLTPRASGAASLMARCATPDVGHPIHWQQFEIVIRHPNDLYLPAHGLDRPMPDNQVLLSNEPRLRDHS
jgi:hypothetical protein